MKRDRLLRLLGRGHAAGADRPDRLVGDHDLRRGARPATPARSSWIWWRSLRSVSPASRSSSVSPTHRIGTRPAVERRRAPSARARGRSRRTARGARSGRARRRATSSSPSIGAEISPVKAPSGSWCMFCAYTSTREPRALSTIARRSVNGTQIATSTPSTRGHARQQRLDVLLGLRLGLVHLPVARDQRGARAHGATSARLRAPARPGSVLALDQLERRAAAGGEVVDRVLAARSCAQRRRRVAAADDRQRRARRRPPRRPRACRPRTARARRRPSGRSRRPSRRRAISLRVARPRCAGPMSRPIQPVRHLDAVEHAVLGVGGERGRRSRGRPAARARRAPGRRPRSQRRARACSTSSSLAQRVADRVALRAQEREAHRAADQQRVGELQEAVDDGDLVGHLGAAEDRDAAGARGARGSAAASRTSRSSSRPAALGQQVRDALGARVRAVGGAERVVDVERRRAPPARARARGRCAPRPARSARSRAAASRRRASSSASAVTSLADDRRARASTVARRSARAGARRPAPSTAPGRACPPGGRGARRGSAARRARAALRSSAAPRGCACRRRPRRPSVARARGTLKSTRTSTRLPRDVEVVEAPHRRSLYSTGSQRGPRAGSSSPTRCRTRRPPSPSCRRSPPSAGSRRSRRTARRRCRWRRSGPRCTA